MRTLKSRGIEYLPQGNTVGEWTQDSNPGSSQRQGSPLLCCIPRLSSWTHYWYHLFGPSVANHHGLLQVWCPQADSIHRDCIPSLSFIPHNWAPLTPAQAYYTESWRDHHWNPGVGQPTSSFLFLSSYHKHDLWTHGIGISQELVRKVLGPYSRPSESETLDVGQVQVWELLL